MSYILEALKKAQAERQLGNAPTLDAVPVGAPPPAASARRGVPAIAVGAGAAALLAVGAGVWWMKAQGPGPAAMTTAPATAVVIPTPVAVPAPGPVNAPLSVAPPSRPVAAAKPAPVVAEMKPAPAAAAPRPASAPAPAPAVKAPVKTAAAEDEYIPALRDVPDNVRASIPQVSFGGYMYSNNPADRLVLIDKMLRHEGEEVAPGLVLEKLLPKAAIMNYRGTRYKVAY